MGNAAVEVGAARAPISESEDGPAAGAGRPGVVGLLAPTLPLLPILLVYTLVVVIHPLPGNYTDEAAFLGIARDLTHGFYTQSNTTVISGLLFHGPGLPLLLLPLVALHIPLTLIRILVGPVFLFAAIAVFHRMLRPFMTERSAILASYAVGAYLPFFPHMRAVYVEALATLCFTLAVYFMVRSFRGGRRDHLWAGLALGWLALSRVEYGYVLVACLLISAVWLLVRRASLPARHSLIACAIGLVMCVPWLSYTYSVTHKPFYWGDSGGWNLFWMSAPGTGDWQSPLTVATRPQLAVDRATIAAVKRLPPLEQDPRLTHIAIQNIRHNPKHYLANIVNNVGRLVFNSPYSYTNEKSSAMLYGVPNAILLGALVISALAAMRTRRRLAVGLAPISIFILLGFLIHVPLAAEARFIVPLIPATAWLVFAVLAPVWPVPGVGASASREALL